MRDPKLKVKTTKTRQRVRKGILLISFLLFPVTFYSKFYDVSPVLIFQASSMGIINFFVIRCIYLFISALFLGRAYCGWVCAAAGCQEALFSVNNEKIRGGDIVKWIIWVPWIIAIILVVISAGGYKGIEVFYLTKKFRSSMSNAGHLAMYLTVFIIVLGLIILPSLTIGRRSFCHHICWFAPFMIIGRKLRNLFKWPSLQLISDPGACKHCHACTEHCPMSLPVEDMINRSNMENLECILCGTCVDTCKFGVIKYDWGRK